MLPIVPPTGDVVQAAGGEMDYAIGLSQGLLWPWFRVQRAQSV